MYFLAAVLQQTVTALATTSLRLLFQKLFHLHTTLPTRAQKRAPECFQIHAIEIKTEKSKING